MDEKNFEANWKDANKRIQMINSFIIIDEHDTFFFDNINLN